MCWQRSALQAAPGAPSRHTGRQPARRSWPLPPSLARPWPGPRLRRGAAASKAALLATMRQQQQQRRQVAASAAERRTSGQLHVPAAAAAAAAMTAAVTVRTVTAPGLVAAAQTQMKMTTATAARANTCALKQPLLLRSGDGVPGRPQPQQSRAAQASAQRSLQQRLQVAPHQQDHRQQGRAARRRSLVPGVAGRWGRATGSRWRHLARGRAAPALAAAVPSTRACTAASEPASAGGRSSAGAGG